jgi:hypothetical protein
VKQEIYKCDVCGKIKGETNHWYAVRLEKSCKPDFLLVKTFKNVLSTEASVDYDHICGSECLHKRVDAMLVAL